MSADEALDIMDRVYHTPLTEPIRQELAALSNDVERYVQIAAEQATEIERLRALLRRYRTETPLGHQPHMIDADVDAALAGRKQP